jgi:hypothetical protein
MQNYGVYWLKNIFKYVVGTKHRPHNTKKKKIKPKL